MTTIVSLCIHRRWPASTFQWGIVNGPCYETVQTSHWLARGAPRAVSLCALFFWKITPNCRLKKGNLQGVWKQTFKVCSSGCKLNHLELFYASLKTLEVFNMYTPLLKKKKKKKKSINLVNLESKRNTALKWNLTDAAVFRSLFPYNCKTSSTLQFIRKTAAKRYLRGKTRIYKSKMALCDVMQKYES